LGNPTFERKEARGCKAAGVLRSVSRQEEMVVRAPSRSGSCNLAPSRKNQFMPLLPAASVTEM
jgi:hypothetical protein